jgi:hypothetical protein
VTFTDLCIAAFLVALRLWLRLSLIMLGFV